MSTNINSTEQIVEINAGDQITNVNIVSQSTTQVISGEQVVTIDTNAGTIPAAWGSITGTLSNQTDLQNALNLKQNNITLTTTGTTGVASLVGSTLNIPNYVSSTKQTQWDSAYNDKINSAEVSGTTTKTLTLTQQDGGIIQASWSDFDTAPVTSVFGRTGDVVSAEGDYNINQLGDVTITSATNGQVLKYNGTAWVNAADASGLTSVGLTVPTGLSVSGSPLTSNGTINVGLQSGYSIPTTVKQAEWDQAYNDKINNASVTGNSTKTLTLTQQDGGTVTASWTDASGLTSVGLAMPSAFTVSGSPLTSNGTITVTGAGTTSQYVRGDGSLATFPTTSNEAKTLIREVYNKTGATLTKGTVVYIDGGQGNLPTITKAIATGDPTSAQTFGIVQSDITNMNNGFVVIAGGIDNLDTQAYTVGTALYLSPTTAGAWTSTKPYAPDHMVYLGVIVRSHPTQGVIEVKIQNGVEISEIHDVSARYPNNKDGLFYNSTSNVWENKSIAGVLGYTPVPQSRIITINGTAQDLSADRTYNVGTVTSVSASGGTGISINGSPVTGSGVISIVNTAPDQTVTITPSGLATVSGTYPNFTVGVSTAYSGSVTSVNASVPTGFEVSGVPITTAGTIDIKFASGYSLPTTAKQTQWDDAYTKRINSLTVTGNSGSSTLVSNVLNVPTYTLSGLGGEPAITAGTSLQYWRGDKTFQTLNTGVVPESGNVYFTEPRVRATVLSGLNITGGSISSSDSVLDAFGKVQNQINGLMGGSIFQSTWNASTNNPTLTSSVGTKGYYYIVSVAGTTNLNGITDWQIGDWAIFDGTVWRKVDNTDAVVSVNGFTGTVSLGISNLADVSASSPTDTQLLRYNGTTSKWYNWTPTFEPALTKGNLTEATSSVLTITGGSNAVIGSGTTIQVKQSSATGSGFLSSTDWNTFNNKQATISLTTTGSSGASTFVSNVLNVPNYTLSGLGGVPTSRTLTINGTGYDLSADRTWSVGTVTSIALATGTSGTDVNVSGSPVTGSGTITLNIPDASATARGLITTGTQTIAGAKTFNSSVSAYSLTATLSITAASAQITTLSGAVYADAAGNLGTTSGTQDTIAYWGSSRSIASLSTATYPSLTELSYVKGVTSAIQTQLNGKLNLTGGTLTGALSGTSATFSGLVTLATGATQNKLNWLGYNSAYTLISSDVGYDATYNGLYITHNTNYAGSAQGNAAIPSWYVNLGGSNQFNISRSNAGSFTFTPLFTLSGTGAATFSSSVSTGTLSLSGSTMQSSGDYYIGTNNANFIQFYTSNQNRMIITSGGSVGIGTTSPSGTGWNSNSLVVQAYKNDIDGALFRATSSNTDFVFSAGNNLAYIATIGEDPIAFYTNTTERMRITSGGNVGIGTTAMSYKLAINTSGAAGAYGNSIEWQKYDNPSAYVGISYDDTNDGLSFNASVGVVGFNKQYMFIKRTNGNVGIGTTSPTSNYGFEKNLTIASANNAELSLSQTGNSNFFSIGITNGFNFFQTTTGQGYVFYIAGTERMRITSGGNVLIGTTTDSGQKLQINGNTYTNGSIKTSNPNGGTATPWKLGSRIVGTCSASTSAYLEVDINGTLYYLAFAVPL